MKSRNPMTIEVTRGPLVESTHEVVAVVADKRRLVVGYSGNTDFVISPRSSIKLLQALPLLETGAADAFNLSDKHIALACASHKAQKHHMEALREWLGIIKQSDSILRCGPESDPSTPLSHNCSGKHLGMVTTAMHLKMNPEKYDHFEHPYQDYLRKYLTEATGIDFTKAPHAIDGCCIPTYGMAIQKLALAMTLFVSDDSNSKRRSCNRIVDAIKKYPQYLSSENDLSHKLIDITKGRAIMKTGAEGAYTGIMPEKGLAFALKVIDGHPRAAEVAALQIFKQYGAIDTADFEKLKEWFEPAIVNSRKEKVGVIRLKPV